MGYSRVLSELNDHWHGPTSAAMAAATVPYLLWLNATAGQAEHTAAKAEAAAAAYEAAFAATVPPPILAANRARLMMLVATNILGQNTPAIAIAEAEYAEMWAQDASAMYGYAGAASAATELTLFEPPQQTTSAAGLAQLVSAMPNALRSLASPSPFAQTTSLGSGFELGGWNPLVPGSVSDTTGYNGVLNAIFGTDTAFGQFANSNVMNTIFISGFFMPARYLGTASKLMSMSPRGAAGSITGSAAGPVGGIGAVGNSVSAAMGRGSIVGTISVPSSWASSPPAPSLAESSLGKAPNMPARAPGSVHTPGAHSRPHRRQGGGTRHSPIRLPSLLRCPPTSSRIRQCRLRLPR